MNNKDKITEAAFLLALKYGFDNVSINQIQEAASVTAGAIYYHFDDKADILLNILNTYFLNNIDEFKSILDSCKGSKFEKLKFLFYCHIGYDIRTKSNFKNSGLEIDYKEYHLLLSGVYHQHPEFRELFDDYDRRVLKFYKYAIQDLFDDDELRDDMSLDDMSLFLFDVFRGFFEVFRGFPDVSLERVVDINTKLLLEAFRK
jgi:AcrR family transcriptional regulator